MSVSESAEVLYRPFWGYSDPRYPEGLWTVRQGLLGDASGGDMGIYIFFAHGAASNLDSSMFNIEQVSLVASNNVDANVGFYTYGMDHLIGTITSVGQARHLALEAVGLSIGFGSAISAESAASMKGVFLGRQWRVGHSAYFVVQTPNVSSSLLTLTAQGYWWGPRSILADGGPQRPPTGLFPT